MIWALLQRERFGRRVVTAPIGVYHDRTGLPVPEALDEVSIADDIRGFAIFSALQDDRPDGSMDLIERADKYRDERLAAFRLAFYRIRGLARELILLAAADGADVTVGSMLRTDKQHAYPVSFVQPRAQRGGNVWQHLRTFRQVLFDAIPDAALRLDGDYIDLASGARDSRCWDCGSGIGLLPGSDPGQANPYVDIAIPTGLDHGRNQVVAQSEAVIAIGGGAGTLSELPFAWIHRRLVIGLRCGGWSERLADQRIDTRVRYADLPEDRVFGADSAEDALALLAQWLPRYAVRHTRIA